MPIWILVAAAAALAMARKGGDSHVSGARRWVWDRERWMRQRGMRMPQRRRLLWNARINGWSHPQELNVQPPAPATDWVPATNLRQHGIYRFAGTRPDGMAPEQLHHALHGAGWHVRHVWHAGDPGMPPNYPVSGAPDALNDPNGYVAEATWGKPSQHMQEGIEAPVEYASGAQTSGYEMGFMPDFEMGFMPDYEMGFMPGYEMGYIAPPPPPGGRPAPPRPAPPGFRPAPPPPRGGGYRPAPPRGYRPAPPRGLRQPQHHWHPHHPHPHYQQQPYAPPDMSQPAPPPDQSYMPPPDDQGPPPYVAPVDVAPVYVPTAVQVPVPTAVPVPVAYNPFADAQPDASQVAPDASLPDTSQADATPDQPAPNGDTQTPDDQDASAGWRGGFGHPSFGHAAFGGHHGPDHRRREQQRLYAQQQAMLAAQAQAQMQMAQMQQPPPDDGGGDDTSGASGGRWGRPRATHILPRHLQQQTQMMPMDTSGYYGTGRGGGGGHGGGGGRGGRGWGGRGGWGRGWGRGWGWGGPGWWGGGWDWPYFGYGYPYAYPYRYPYAYPFYPGGFAYPFYPYGGFDPYGVVVAGDKC
jgi:hypothetical protein